MTNLVVKFVWNAHKVKIHLTLTKEMVFKTYKTEKENMNYKI